MKAGKYKDIIASNPKLYQRYRSMKQRCYSPDDKNYKYYGGRGITVCDEWLNNYESFYNWAYTNGFTEGLTIDRIDSKKEYSPDNCRWADKFTQGQNKRIRVDNRTGITGVDILKGKFRSSIKWYGQRLHLGLFKTLAEAKAARVAAEKVCGALIRKEK